jgi:uncharacterized protein with PQ loop repeat
MVTQATVDLLGWWCTAITILITIPQIWRVRGGRPVEGLSQITLLMAQSASFFWVVYGVLNDDVALMITNSFVLVSQLLVWIALLRADKTSWNNWLAMAGATGLVAGIAFVTTPGVAGAAASVFGVLNLVPMVRICLHQSDLRGISVVSTALLVTAVASWLTYGLLRPDWVIVACNAVILPMALTILIQTVRSNRSFRFIEFNT